MTTSRLLRSALAAALLAAAAAAPCLSLDGRVVDEQAQPIAGASVEMVGAGLATLTDAAGRYSFAMSARVPVPVPAASASGAIELKGNILTVAAAPMARVAAVEILDLKGRLQVLTRHSLPAGTALAVQLGSGRLSPGAYLVRVEAGGQRRVLRWSACGQGSGSAAVAPVTGLSAVAKALAPAIDSLHCWKSGYENEVAPFDSMTGTLTDIVLRRGIAFEPYFRGSGRVLDLATGDTVSLAPGRMVHVVVFPEGYLQSDLDSGRYEQDLARWYQEVFTLDVMGFLKEAFVIWKLPLASSEHLLTDGVVDSYFRMPLAAGAMAGSGYDTAAARTWRLVSRFPFAPTQFVTALNARNLVCSYMLYDTRYRRSGFSGLTTSFANPANAAQRVYAAIALGQQHEFMHALARLGDEYYDTTQTPLSDNSLRLESRYVTNVVSRNTCDTLPWKHLLVGGPYNPSTDSLVGAFGTNGRYHPEFKCLMNGSHHNAMLYGGSNNLRTDTRLCNFCRELTVFRVYERSQVLSDVATSYPAWVAAYRAAFYNRLGFAVPAVVPQQNSVATPWFLACQ